MTNLMTNRNKKRLPFSGQPFRYNNIYMLILTKY